MSAQQYVILGRDDSGDGMPPMGGREEVIDQLAAFNTAPESDEGNEILYGPGIRIELPPADPVTQMLLTITEEEIAWLVIMHLAKELSWTILDPISGRKLNP